MPTMMHTLPLIQGDVAKIEIIRQADCLQLRIYEHREGEPLILATLSRFEVQILSFTLTREARFLHRSGQRGKPRHTTNTGKEVSK